MNTWEPCNRPIIIVLCDGMPNSVALGKFAFQRGLKRVNQIGHCSTFTSIASMFTGFMPSDLISHGFGYHTKSFEQWRDVKTKIITPPWYESQILYEFDEDGREIDLHNVTPDSWYHSYKCTDSYAGGYAMRLCDIVKANDSHFSVKMMNPILVNSHEEWRINELAYLTEELPNNDITFIEYLHFHAYGDFVRERGLNEDKALYYMLEAEILEFLEIICLAAYLNNAILWFFSDHGFQRAFDIVPPVNSFLSWVVTNIPIPQQVIGIDDFPQIIRGKFPERFIYFVEDGRKQYDEYNSTTASAIKVLGNLPFTAIMETYFSQTNKWYTNKIIGTNMFPYKQDENLKYELARRFEWVP